MQMYCNKVKELLFFCYAMIVKINNFFCTVW